MPFTLTEGGLLATGGFLVDAFTCSTHHHQISYFPLVGQLSPHKEASTQNAQCLSMAQVPRKITIQAFGTLPQLCAVSLRASWAARGISSVRNSYPENNTTPENSYSPWQSLHPRSQPLKDTGWQVEISSAVEVTEALLLRQLQHSF